METALPARRDLRPFPLERVTFTGPGVYVTMSEGRWDPLLAAAYQQGCVLLEMDAHERLLRAYRRAENDV
jgi:hypothetical protein